MTVINIIENGDFPDGTIPPSGPITDVFDLDAEAPEEVLFQTSISPGPVVSVGVEGGVTGSSTATFDVDAFAVTLFDGDVFEIRVNASNSAGNPLSDYEIGVFDDTLSQIAGGIGSGFRTFSFRADEAGAINGRQFLFTINGFFVDTDPGNPVATGDYRLEVGGERDDHGRFLQTATRVDPGSTTSGRLVDAEDRDALFIDADIGERVTVTLTGSSSGVLPGTIRNLDLLSGFGAQFTTVSETATSFVVDVFAAGRIGARVSANQRDTFDLTFAVTQGVAIGDDAALADQTIAAFSGDDTLLGGAGDDLLEGGAGGDSHQGGAGIDTVDFRDSPGGISVRLNQGVGFLSDASGDTFVGIEDVLGSDGDDFIQGEDGANRLLGRGGADELRGLGGDDLLLGRAGADTLLGQAGADILFGGAGDDDLDGAQGGGLISGGVGNDAVEGGSGVDTLFGGAGNDTLDGEGGNDLLFGGPGRDVLSGGNGADRLNGNGGGDVLTGGAGADVFVYSAGRDTISDFTAGDRIDLSDLSAVSGVDDLVFFDNGGRDRGFSFAPETGLAGRVLLPIVDLTELDAADFIFAS